MRVARRLHGLDGRGHAPTTTAPAGAGAEVEVGALLDLLEAACVVGAGVPRALEAVGRSAGGVRGRALREAGAALLLGATWADAWARTPDVLRPVERALRPAWDEGTPAAALLRSAAEAVRRDRHARATHEAARLGVRLVLPLGLCHLPAFVLVGLVPVVVSMAADGLAG
ncbi:type II secretion system F family protein [Cellulomonas carbonis]|uniref:Secretion system protein n=1 Tax=Cellulomonas carbonis T26 TaxID=947969 RepID=A0A0A0BK85_9CELL|nr:type II secretion system F family protein [Cellulomonas carbonis]KGM08401.1 secretion system protein [Cellulomonas carbonis T26]GGC04344.1 hypothetical protein GCM10010972_16910 [Cellulomonas carbonis]